MPYMHLLWKIAVIFVLISQEGWKLGTTQDVSGNNVKWQNGSRSAGVGWMYFFSS